MIYCKEGIIIEFDEGKYNNEKDKYTEMWKGKYGVEIPKEKTISVKEVVDYISGKKFSL